MGESYGDTDDVSWLLAVVIALVLLGGGYLVFTVNLPSQRQTVVTSNPLAVYTDTETGCQYVARNGSITPRMGSDGKQLCPPPNT